MRKQSGVTLIELLVVVAIGALLFGVTLVYSLQWMAQETMNGAAKDVAAFIQLAKIEAISRNRECRFVINPGTGILEVWDAVGTTGDPSDDELLHSRTLPTAVRFARPDQDTGQITMTAVGGNDFQAMFTSDGIVSSGDGAVHVRGGERFGRITVYVAGGVQIQYWDGANWGEWIVSGTNTGFTLIEVVIALFIISVGVLATAPLFVLAAEDNAIGDDMTTIGVIAVQRLEQMRSVTFFELPVGGSLSTDVAGYFDDSDPDYLVRWQIVNANTTPNVRRLIVIRVIASRQVRGMPKDVTVTTLRSI